MNWEIFNQKKVREYMLSLTRLTSVLPPVILFHLLLSIVEDHSLICSKFIRSLRTGTQRINTENQRALKTVQTISWRLCTSKISLKVSLVNGMGSLASQVHMTNRLPQFSLYWMILAKGSVVSHFLQSKMFLNKNGKMRSFSTKTQKT